MNISKELLEKAKTAKTAKELLEMAKAENIELTEEEAAKAFEELNKNGELSDEELDNVAGGCGDLSWGSYVEKFENSLVPYVNLTRIGETQGDRK